MSALHLLEATWSTLSARFEQSFSAELSDEVGRQLFATGLVRTVSADVRAYRTADNFALVIDDIEGSSITRLEVYDGHWEAVLRDGTRRQGDGRRTKHGSFGVMFLLRPRAIFRYAAIIDERPLSGESGHRLVRVASQPVISLDDDGDGVAWEFGEPTDPWPFVADDVGYRNATSYEATIAPDLGIVQRWDAERDDQTVLRRLELLDIVVK